jgi:hypothetical protein
MKREMTMRNRLALPALALLSATSLGACARKVSSGTPTPAPAAAAVPAPVAFKFVSLDLGTTVWDGKKVRQANAEFGLHDTIFASVLTDGATPRATIKARWTYGAGNTLVNEEARDVSPTGSAVTGFHIEKKSGWPVGDYKVEISVDGSVVATKGFKVAKS